MKALRNVALLTSVVSRRALAELMLDSIVNRHLVFAIQTTSATLCDEVTLQKCEMVSDLYGMLFSLGFLFASQIVKTLGDSLFLKSSPEQKPDDTLRPSQLTTYTQTQIDPLAKLLYRSGLAVHKHQKRCVFFSSTLTFALTFQRWRIGSAQDSLLATHTRSARASGCAAAGHWR